MTKILLIRHGEAAKGPDIPDPELTALGHKQAENLAREFAAESPIALVSSPKLRTQQTARPLAKVWRRPIALEAAVTEIPSPSHIPLQKRAAWIRLLLESDWDENDAQQVAWRRGVLEYLLTLEQDTAVFCHFMVINSVVAHIRNHRKIQQFRPDYTSVTELCLKGGALELVRLGKEKSSRIL
ncbi:histidine phosphatase family protein [Microbulbifer thermotolerans]|uniref:Broad specificity phosphatase PhoE n=1 Tax=Microbulbifer thermotolerans TaxID=252514 RepID=A0A143HN52_MICTH|nr:histidine phosphatase family protein [Microbulbifer thermotolerans]AMX02941.1 hypothetical protein A3224_10485 [Microbulbifer thermotolerans]